MEDGIGKGTNNAGFSNSGLERFAIGILGDLHLEPAQMSIFHRAAEQMRSSLTGSAGEEGARLVQLGDLGGYNHRPGSSQCFRVASEYLGTFRIPAALVTGNHDLESDEFLTDEENLAAWKQAFEQRHFWAAEVGPTLCLGLSTVRFRSNKDSVHEVFIDDEQLDWFERRLEESAGRPVVVFTHAPPLGCGLKVVEGVHVKNRCAWLNHSSNPGVFLSFVRRFRNIKLWFSGHYHLSQNYPTSISTVASCAFVQTGVIGECDRDGFHQSRILQGDKDGYRLLTLNHATGEERLDLQQSWAQVDAPKTEWLSKPPQRWWPQALLFHQNSPEAGDSARTGNGAHSSKSVPREQWFGSGHDQVLRRKGQLLIEYNASYRAAVGAVFTDLDESLDIRLVDAEGHRVKSEAAESQLPKEDGSAATAIEAVDKHGSVKRRVERNLEGSFFQIFQKNKWRARQAELRQSGALPALR